MATVFKTLNNNDVVSTRTLLHEAIPVTGTIVSGTYNNENVNEKVSLPISEDQSSDSKIQSRTSSQKPGWCYIGTDRNVRSCIKVNASTKCMSGDIFTTRAKCINPNLRN